MNKINNQLRQNIAKILACLFCYWSLSKTGQNYYDTEQNKNQQLFQPHPVQVLSILKFLGCDDRDNNLTKYTVNLFGYRIPKLKNQLMQIKTGEGKSIILGMMSLILALMGNQVYQVCYSEYLYKRDYNDFQDIFKDFNVKHMITYGTFNMIAERLINQTGDIRNQVNKLFKSGNIIQQKKYQSKNKINNRVLLVDQVDTFFSKNFYGNIYNPATILKNKYISQIIDIIWNNKTQNNQQIQILYKQSQAYKKICQQYKDCIQKINQQFSIMITDVKKYKQRDYIINENKIGYKQLDGISYTTKYSYQTMFLYMLQLQKGNTTQKQLNKYKGISLSCGHFSYAQMIEGFDGIFGVTGTLDKLNQFQNQILKRYNIQLKTFAPSVYGESRKQQKPIQIEEKEPQFYQTLATKINNYVQNKNGIIVFFQGIKEIDKFIDSSYCDTFRNKIKVVTQKTENRDFYITKATQSKSITFFTACFGRGTDFVVYDPIVKQLGLVVIQTFLSEQISEQIQIIGRTARQGAKGIYQLVLLLENICKFGISLQNIQKVKQNQKSTINNFLQQKRVEFNKKINQQRQKQIQQAKKDHQSSMEKRKLIIYKKINRNDSFFYKPLVNSLPTHYIYALDQSNSMAGQRWKQLMRALKQAINQLKNSPQSEQNLVTILPFASTCRIHQQKVIPINVNLNIQYLSGGTDFKQPLQMAFKIMNQTIQNYCINFVFMTDGEASYPGNQVQKIKNLMKAHNGKINFSGLEYMHSGDVIPRISKQLEGNNIIINKPQSLAKYLKQNIH